MEPYEFIKNEKIDGCLKPFVKDNGKAHIGIDQVHVLMRRYADYMYKEKISHLDLNNYHANYVKGRESVLRELDATLTDMHEQQQEDIKNHKAKKRIKKYFLFTQEQLSQQITEFRLIIRAKMRLTLKNKL